MKEFYNEGRFSNADRIERYSKPVVNCDDLNKSEEFDVIVIGGGIAGCAAAISSARAGARTLLIEKLIFLGGLATAGHIVIYLPLDDGYGHQVIAGLSEELLHLSVKYSYQKSMIGCGESRKRYEADFNGPAFSLALEELVIQSGVNILYDTVFVGSVLDESKVTGIIVENKSGRHLYKCAAVVDASGDAELFARAGVDCISRENSLAIWTYITKGEAKMVSKRGSFFEQGLMLLAMGSADEKSKRVYYGDTAEEINKFIKEGHKQLLSLLKADRTLTLASLPSMAQLRMVRRICGKYTLSDNDISQHFYDSIGVAGDWRKPAPVYEIPFRTLYSSKLSNVFAAGRCISAGGDAWEITRVIPVAALTGQVAGIAAAIIAEKHIDICDIDIYALQAALTNAGVLIRADF